MAEVDSSAVVERIYPALWRPRLWLGCNILPLILLALGSLFSVPLALHTRNLWWMLLGGASIGIGTVVLRKFAQFDPDFFTVMYRYRRYDRVYAAIGGVNTALPSPRRHQR